MIHTSTVIWTYATCSSCKAEVRLLPLKSGGQKMARHNKRGRVLADVCAGTEWHAERKKKEQVGHICF